MSLREAQTRLAYYARVVALNRRSVTIVDAGRELAVLGPVAGKPVAGKPVGEKPVGGTPVGERPVGAKPPAEKPEPPESERLKQVSAGWANRLESVRADLQRRHAADVAVLRQALAEVWQRLDEVAPRGIDARVDQLRAAQRDLLAG